jgi:nucleotide-binding universal stress UspA family protein
MKTIILPTDFSENARNASRFALSMFGGNAENRFVVINSFEIPYSTSEILVSVNELIENDSKEGVEKEIALLRQLATMPGTRIEGVSIYGEAVTEIANAAQKQAADYIVMGTTGVSGFMETFVGSVTSSVIKNADTPVLVVPEGVSYTPPKNIVFAADYGSLKDVSELSPLKQIALEFGSTITLLNVLRKGELTDVDEAVEGLKINSYFMGMPLKYAFLENDDIEAGINDYVLNNPVDMIAMVERKVSFFEKLFHKSITKQVAHHIKLPLLVMHDAEK